MHDRGRIVHAAAIVVAVLAGASFVPAAAESKPSTSSASKVSQLELAKLRLDIKKLKQDTGPEGKRRAYIPLVSVAVALLVALIGVWRYLRDQRRARKLREEDLIAGNLERLIDLPSDALGANARVVCALRALGVLTSPSSGLWGRLRRGSSVRESRRSIVTTALATLVTQDLVEYQNASQASIPVLCVEQWPPFEHQLRSHPDVLRFVLGRYRRALERLHQQDALYFSTVTRDASGAYAPPPSVANEAGLLLLQRVVEGYVVYAALVDAAVRATIRQEFAQALRNGPLTAVVFAEGS